MRQHEYTCEIIRPVAWSFVTGRVRLYDRSCEPMRPVVFLIVNICVILKERLQVINCCKIVFHITSLNDTFPLFATDCCFHVIPECPEFC